MSIDIAFTKGHGTGNDFVLFSDPDGEVTLADAQIAALADRRFGVGGDGVIRAVRSERLPEGAAVLAEDASAEWFMDYHNADGSAAEMCGNGIRVFGAYLLAEGLLDLAVGETVAIGTRGGVRQLSRTGMITHTKLSSVLNTPGLTSSLSSKNTSSFVSARSGSMTNCGLKATCRSGPL